MSAIASTGSTLLPEVVPSVATTATGRIPLATSSAMAAPSASGIILYSPSVLM